MKDFQRKVDDLLTSDEIKKIRKKYGLSQREFAQILEIGEKSFTKYELGIVGQSRAMDNLLRLLDEFPECLSWLKRRREYIENSKKKVVATIYDFQQYKNEQQKSKYQTNVDLMTESDSNEYNIA